MAHTIKVWKRIMKQRIREKTSIGEGQLGFMPSKRTTDAAFILKHIVTVGREKKTFGYGPNVRKAVIPFMNGECGGLLNLRAII